MKTPHSRLGQCSADDVVVGARRAVARSRDRQFTAKSDAMASRSSGRVASAVISRTKSSSSRCTDHVTNRQHSRSAATSASSSLAPLASTRQRISNRFASRRPRGSDLSARACHRRTLVAPSSAPKLHATGNSTGFVTSSRSTETPSQDQDGRARGRMRAVADLVRRLVRPACRHRSGPQAQASHAMAASWRATAARPRVERRIASSRARLCRSRRI